VSRFFIARHGETVFNAAARMQGEAPHTPLTRTGFAQADSIGEALLARLGPRPRLTMWSSPAGRALQTLAIAAEHLGLDWHQARTDARLAEIDVGAWGGRTYREIAEENGKLVDPHTSLFSVRPPGGEWFPDIARRLQSWLDDIAAEEGDRLVLMHGVSSRVLRGMLTGAPIRPECDAPVADGLPQGSVVEIEDGRETLLRP